MDAGCSISSKLTAVGKNAGNMLLNSSTKNETTELVSSKNKSLKSINSHPPVKKKPRKSEWLCCVPPDVRRERLFKGV
jgi:hypothetical protein